ncbi:hypothetical protein [Microbacterium sp.]
MHVEARLLSGGDDEMFADCGHYIPLQAPGRLAQRLRMLAS